MAYVRTQRRRTSIVGCVAAAATAFTVFTALRARADSKEAALVYEHDAGGSCPSEAEFFAKVRKHTSRWSAARDPTSAGRTIRVRLTARGAETVGTLVVADATGTLSERTIAGPTCEGVARAVAIMVGVAIDPDGDRPSTEAPVSKAEAPKAAPEPVADKPRSEPSPRTQPPFVHSKSPAFAPRLAFDARLESTSAVIRGGLMGVGASMKVLLPAGAGAQSRGWRPSLALGVRQSLPKERALRGGEVDFTWTAGNLRVCPHDLSIARVLELSPCAEMNLGVLRASAENFADARDASMTWLDVGASVSLTVPLTERLFFSSTALVTVPIVRRHFLLGSGASAASVPPAGVLGGIGLGIRM